MENKNRNTFVEEQFLRLKAINIKINWVPMDFL